MSELKQDGPDLNENDPTKPRYTELSQEKNRPTEMGIIGDADVLIGKGFERQFINSEMEFKTSAGDYAYCGNRVGMVTAVTKNLTTGRIETITVKEDLGALPLEWRGQAVAFGYDNQPNSQSKTTVYAIGKGLAAEVINGAGAVLTTGSILICRARTEDKTTWTKEAVIAEILNSRFEEIEPIVSYNFDLTSPNWAYEGFTDEASFINWLANRQYSYANDLTNIIVTDFNFEGDRVFCNMTADGTIYDLSGLGLINADKIGVVNGLTNLSFYGDKIVTFNPTIPLPSSLTDLALDFNKMTLAGYTASEVWANAQPAFTNPCHVNFGSNIDSITGTNLEAILLTKNCVITA